MIDENVYMDFRTAINEIGSYDPVTFIIHTKGGFTNSGWGIAACIMNRSSPTTVVVPEEALSMGTMITVSANSIIMFPDAYLSPIDPQMFIQGHWLSALDLLEDDDRLVRVKATRAIELAEERLRQVCGSKLSGEKLDKLVERLLLKDKEHADHASSIFFPELKKLGLNVEKRTIDNIKALHMFYQRCVFHEKDPSTIIEYNRKSITSEEK